jgi:putative Ca2+/H+ antiporter (TMEM165/GDT1 family)
MNATLFGTAFVAVLLAELVGDKLVYGTGALAARFGAWSVVLGAIPALAIKSLVAVTLGGFVSRLPPMVVAISSALAFGFAAYSIWREPPRSAYGKETARVARPVSLRGGMSAFRAIFFAEWGDAGQLAAAAMAARFGAPSVVWAAASVAMATKLLFALTVGSVVYRYAPQRAVRWAGVSLSAVLAVTAAFHIG